MAIVVMIDGESDGERGESSDLCGRKRSYFADRLIPVKLDRDTLRSATDVGFRPIEKAEHQGCCDWILPESGWNRNPALDSGPQQTGKKTGMCHLANWLVLKVGATAK